MDLGEYALLRTALIVLAAFNLNPIEKSTRNVAKCCCHGVTSDSERNRAEISIEGHTKPTTWSHFGLRKN